MDTDNKGIEIAELLMEDGNNGRPDCNCCFIIEFCSGPVLLKVKLLKLIFQ